MVGATLHTSPLSISTLTRDGIQLLTPQSAADISEARTILREYASSLPIDLSFQEFDRELQELPGDYASPRGTLLLAWHGRDLAGCCGLRPLDTVDYPNACEMKRLYVRPAFRRLGLGRLLAETIMDTARIAGYATILLDTLNEMEAARALYEDLGFEAIPPFYRSPISGAHYLKARL